MAEWYSAANWPIDAGDYALTASGSALAGASIAGIATSASNDFPLTGVGAVSLTGLTALRLHVSGGQPSGDNFVQFAAFEHASLPEPRLIVTYTTP